MSAAKLYTAEVLGLAVELATVPPIADATVAGDARSAACGSTLSLGLRLDHGGRVEAVGLQVCACAIGQAAAALFARAAVGRDMADLRAAHEQISRWLAGEMPLPEWPDLALLEPARAFPGRHGAILLPWQAAVSALSLAPSPA